MKKKTGEMFLKVVGILLILGGVVGILNSVSNIMLSNSIRNGQVTEEMLDLLEQAAGPMAVDPGALMRAGIFSLVCVLANLVLAVLGVKYCKRLEKGKLTFGFGLALIAIALIVQAYNAFCGTMSLLNLVISLVLPLLYTWGGFRNMQAYAEAGSGSEDTLNEKKKKKI